jgi:hypothetical protein
MLQGGLLHQEFLDYDQNHWPFPSFEFPSRCRNTRAPRQVIDSQTFPSSSRLGYLCRRWFLVHCVCWRRIEKHGVINSNLAIEFWIFEFNIYHRKKTFSHISHTHALSSFNFAYFFISNFHKTPSRHFVNFCFVIFTWGRLFKGGLALTLG